MAAAFTASVTLQMPVGLDGRAGEWLGRANWRDLVAATVVEGDDALGSSGRDEGAVVITE